MEKGRCLVTGGAGFIGHHLIRRLTRDGYWVRGVDLKMPEYGKSSANEFVCSDLRDQQSCMKIFDQPFDAVYQLAADMGGAGYIFTGDHDADVMHNSVQINLNMLHFGRLAKIKNIFFSSSACIYPERNQTDPKHPNLAEESAYPAGPDSEYGWEKLFSERLYLAYKRNYGMNVHIARFHNIFGSEASWNNGKEKSLAAICRKVAMTKDGGSIDIWGDGNQTRSFLYIDDCLEGITRLMNSSFTGPVNIGSEEMVSINDLAGMIMRIAGKKLVIHHVSGPLGVRGRSSDNTLIRQKLGWAPSSKLYDGLVTTYVWIDKQVRLTDGKTHV